MEDSILVELEIVLGVVVGNVLNHTRETFHIVWQQTLLHIVSEQVAKQTSEILMARVAQERAAVGKHSDKAAEESKDRQGIHLACHTVELVIEPPS